MINFDEMAWSNDENDIRLQSLMRITSLKKNQTTPKLLNNHRLVQAKRGLALEFDDMRYHESIESLETI